MPRVKNSKYKVQISNLPEGFELIDGELVKKSHGGHVTGDQYNYGLTTFNTHADQSTGPIDTDVRYSLSSVPRNIANIEAEGGETVLTDLNNDGQFGLYDITGPRHSSGGVPMFLPEQSFIYSDTQKMKMGKEMLADHGIKSRKKITPAKVSKQYGLNKYYGILNDEYADKIQANTADLMLQKNKEGLSKLAFGQEMMKGFEDGLPLAAFPYVQSIGIDPKEFAQKVEGLQQFTGDQQAQPMNQADMQAMNPMAAYGRELRMAQNGIGDIVDLSMFPGAQQAQQNTSGIPFNMSGPMASGMNQTTQPTQQNNAYSNLITQPGQLSNQLVMGNYSSVTPKIQNPAGPNIDPVTGADSDMFPTEIAQKVPEEKPEGPNFGTKLNTGIQGFMNSPGMNAFKETSMFGVKLADGINEKFKDAKGKQAKQDMLKMSMADNMMGTSYDPNMSRGVWDTNTGLINKNMEGDASVSGGFAGYRGYGQDGMEVTEDFSIAPADGTFVDTSVMDRSIEDLNRQRSLQMFIKRIQDGGIDPNVVPANPFNNDVENTNMMVSQGVTMMQGGGGTPSWKTGDNLMGGTDTWVDWYNSPENKKGREQRYETYKLIQKSRGAKEEDLPSAEDFHKNYVRTERQINAIQDYYGETDPDFLTRSDWDSDSEFDPKYKDKAAARAAKAKITKLGVNHRYKQAIAAVNKKIAEENPDATPDELKELQFEALDDAGIKQFQGAYQAGQIYDLAGANDNYIDFVSEGLKDDSWTYGGKTYDASPVDGAFGNTTVGQRENTTIPEYPCDVCPDGPDKGKVPQRDENGNCPCGECPQCPEGESPGTPTASEPCPCVKDPETPEVPDPGEPPTPPTKAPWIQDVIKTQAIADRERDMFLPYQPPVRRNYMDAVLEDPTRQIAAINSGRAASEQANAAFAGPQQLAARNAQQQGQSIDAIANAVGGVNQRNVQTLNQANRINAQLDSQFNQQEDARNTKLYDDTAKTLQTYMDEKNFDREQYADSVANMITNMSNTYNQNQLYDYFNVDPLSGGDIRQTGSKAFDPQPEQDRWAFMNDYMEAAKRAKTAGMVDKDGNVDPNVMASLVQQANARGYSGDPREARWKANARQSGVGGYGGKRGKEVKRWATPFYTGKMGI